MDFKVFRAEYDDLLPQLTFAASTDVRVRISFLIDGER